MRHIFLSPHMDDVVLSAGSYILTLLTKKESVSVITVFTEFGKRPISLNAQKYLFDSGCLRLSAFSIKRKTEDKKAMDLLGTPYTYLAYIDGGFRKDKKNAKVYPTFHHLFSGYIVEADKELIKQITTDLSSVIKKSDIIYAPLGIGNHADHIIINQIAQTLPNRKCFWLDQPYAWKAKMNHHYGYKETFRVTHQKKKERILSCYRSQIKQLYPHGIPHIDELFLTKA